MSKRLTINILAGIFIFFPTISWGVLYHTVSGDETLWRIAKKYGISVEELQQINGLNGNLIYKGQRLCVQKENTECRIRNEKDRRQKPEARSQKPESMEENVKGSGQEAGIVQETISSPQKSHVVKKGDTLFSIARRNGCTVNELKRLNHLVDNTIEVNQVLALCNSIPCQWVTPQVNAKGAPLAEGVPPAEEPPLADDAHLPDVFAADEGAPLAEKASPVVEEKYWDAVDSAAIADIQFSENPSAIASQIVDTAKRYLYLPYKSGGEIGDEATDCSGFVKRTFGYFGIMLPRTAREQWGKGSPVTELQEGDLVFFATYASYPSHVGIYIGGDRFIHSSSYRSGGVRIDSLGSPYYHQRYLGARRVVAVE
ncbi:MAG: LysM peptidoglycan-binding domain-containing protein [bacterium]|nr:LysM peptidoglycan-binding domain-containing protein [bacterium]